MSAKPSTGSKSSRPASEEAVVPMESVIGNAVAADRPKMKSKEYRREMRRLQGELVGHAEVGPANRRQSVHRVRGTGLGGPGWHDPADHRADQSAGVRAHRLGDSDRAGEF